MTIGKFLQRAILLGGLIAAVQVVPALAATQVEITGDNVNVRSGPSINASVVSRVNTGNEVTFLAVEDDWVKVKLDNGTSAYISAQFAVPKKVDGLVIAANVNVRALPNTSSEVLGLVSAGEVYEAFGVCGDFYAITYKDGATAYIHQDYLLGAYLPLLPEVAAVTTASASAETESAPAEIPAEQKYVVVESGTGLKLRRGPSLDADVLVILSNKEAADLLVSGASWHQVSYMGLTGYVSAEFVTIHAGQKPEQAGRMDLVAYAQKFLGTRYVWGGTSLTKGVDCSGFVYAVFRDFGYSLNRTSRDQIKNGVRVSKAELLPGDLVFFDTTNATNQGYISHVGIYIGGGQFIHASSSSRTPYVTISGLDENYYAIRYVGATRIVQ